MPHRGEDTIAAVATPPGQGGVGIVRVSGSAAADVAAAVLGRVPPPRLARFMRFRDPDGGVIDEGIALFFPGPASFTGEDVLELQGHGGPVVMDLLLAAVLRHGARLARPGEFSERAFLNGKLDLAQAEAVADLIEASSAQAARSALRSLQGAFSERINALSEGIVELRMYVESAIDFPDEEIDFLSTGDVGERLVVLRNAVDGIWQSARQGCLLRDGMTVVIAGRPNAGKSSLLNALAGRATAIVTEIPGTTRDLLRERIDIDGMPLHITDTAGLRESGDRVEQEGIRRAWAEIARADRILLMVDDQEGVGPEDAALIARAEAPVTLVFNKVDLTGRAPGVSDTDHGPAVAISARSGDGIDALRTHLKEVMGFVPQEGGDFLARRRHLAALEQAAVHLDGAIAEFASSRAGELVAEELRLAHRALGEITGEFTADDLLDRIFASFCIGK